MTLLRYVLVFSFLFKVDYSFAEPWIANRFAQNCAGCHAPGRLNRPPAKRRCTLSCQGCHVNPNGGGLRNRYGKWNEERWLRSFYTGIAWNKKSTAPLEKQIYHEPNLKKLAMAKLKKGKKSQKGKVRKKQLAKMMKRIKKEFAKEGAPLIEVPVAITDDTAFFESSNYKSAKNLSEELVRISKGDPYREERKNMLTAGGDLRFFYLQRSEGGQGTPLEDGTFFPMVFDFGVRVRPIKENLSFVYEGRVLNLGNLGPGGAPSSLDKLFGPRGAGINRSAYVLVDDLWYNSYAQIGFFRPMFGLYNANHTAMLNDYTDLGFNVTLKQAGFGTAPNVPFAIVNYIMPSEGVGAGSIAAEDGFNITAGMRFVSFGAHATAHYWTSEDSQGLTTRKRTMWNVNAGAVFLKNRIIVNGEVTSVRKEVNGLDETKIFGLDVRGRFWREMYITASFAQANAAIDPTAPSGTGIGPGSATETAFGVRSFWISGLETEILMVNKSNKVNNGADTNEATMMFQMHAYF